MPKQLSNGQIMLRTLTIISIVEFTIMDSFIFFDIDLSPYVEAIVDTLLLATFTTPLLYVWVIRPFNDPD